MISGEYAIVAGELADRLPGRSIALMASGFSSPGFGFDQGSDRPVVGLLGLDDLPHGLPAPKPLGLLGRSLLLGHLLDVGVVVVGARQRDGSLGGAQ
jgi:hypothetical protein